MQELLSLIAVGIVPIILLVIASLSVVRVVNSSLVVRLLKFSSIFGIVASILGIIGVAIFGTIESSLIGWQNLGLMVRLDSLSMTMMAMIAILAFVIIRFSSNYLDGDPRKGVFLARLATTIASVEFLVLSGNLFQLLAFWIITSVCLHYLLVFYRNRPQAVAAARKKFIVARLADAALFLSFMMIYSSFGTGNLGDIFTQIQNIEFLDAQLITASVFLAIAAVLKSAQFPTHSWLIEVVETPTPVSALLHAGLLNAGPFLIVRMSMLMTEATLGSMILIIIGGITALLASIIYMTQSSIKVALGYSSIAHMGFSLLICGFGIYSAALLHVIGHSFYKAHSFLSSGSIVDNVRIRSIQTPKRSGNIFKVALSLVCASTIFLAVYQFLEIDFQNNFNLMVTGAIIVLGLSQFIVSTVDTKGTFSAITYSVVASFMITISFFALESGVRFILDSQIPVESGHNFIIESGAAVVLSIFAVTILVQLCSPRLSGYEWTRKMGIHLRNGLYANVIFDRMIGSLKNEKFKWANLTVKEDTPEYFNKESDLKQLEFTTKD